MNIMPPKIAASGAFAPTAKLITPKSGRRSLKHSLRHLLQKTGLGLASFLSPAASSPSSKRGYSPDIGIGRNDHDLNSFVIAGSPVSLALE